MRALIYKEFVQLRHYLLQVSAAIILSVVLFGNSLEGFISSYLSIMPLVMALTFPQFLFGMEDKGNTLVFLRSLPVRPRQIVAAKYIVSVMIVLGLTLFGLGYAATVGGLESALVRVGPNLVIAAFLLAISLYLHFRLGTNSAKIALLVSLMLLTLLGLAVMQNRQILSKAGALPIVQWVLATLDSWQGVILGLVVGAGILMLSYMASSHAFSRQDVSRIP